MNTITINQSLLLAELTNALNSATGTDWDIYVNLQGNVDCRHNTYNNNGWAELLDLYGWECWADENELHPGDTGYNSASLATWLVNNTDWLQNTVVTLDVNGEETEFSIHVDAEA